MRFSVYVRGKRRDQIARSILQNPIPLFILLKIGGIDILCSIYFKDCSFQIFCFVDKILFQSTQDLPCFDNMKFTLYWMVFIDCLHNNICGNAVHLIRCIRINIHFIIILVQCITKRRLHFFNTVTSDLQVLRQDQIPLPIREIRGMCDNCRISCYLLHIFLPVQIIQFKLCIFYKNRLLCLIVLLYDFQFCRKFMIQKHTPYLRCGRHMFLDFDKEILYRLIIMRGSCLPHKICTIRQCNTAGIAFFIRKNFRCTVFPDHNRRSRSKIITAIFFHCQGRCQISAKPGPGKQFCICLPVICDLDDLERLFLYLFQRGTFPLYRSHQIAFIAAYKVIFRFICQIADGRSDLFYEIFSEIEIFNPGFSFFIRCQSPNLFPSFIEHACLSIRMNDILSRIETINGRFQRSIPLRPAFFRLQILLVQHNRCIYPLIHKCMSKRYDCFPVMGICKPERIYIIGIPQIVFRSLNLFDIITKPNRQIRSK